MTVDILYNNNCIVYQIPTDRDRASMVILLNVKPNKFIIANVEIIDVGIASALNIVILILRRKNRTAIR